jgi:hypothetical protein
LVASRRSRKPSGVEPTRSIGVANCESDLRNRRRFGSQESKRHTVADMIERYLHEGFQHKPRSFKKPGPAVGRR